MKLSQEDKEDIRLDIIKIDEAIDLKSKERSILSKDINLLLKEALRLETQLKN